MADYLFNGIRLPELPARSSVEVSNGFLYDNLSRTADGGYTLLRALDPQKYYDGYEVCHDAEGTAFFNYDFVDGAWVTDGSVTNGYAWSQDPDKGLTLVWTNHDVLSYYNGGLYMAATEPVPVGTGLDPLSFWIGRLLGRAVWGAAQ